MCPINPRSMSLSGLLWFYYYFRVHRDDMKKRNLVSNRLSALPLLALVFCEYTHHVGSYYPLFGSSPEEE